MRAAHAGAQRAAGFTLIELIAVVLIIAIATGLAAVAMTGGLDGMRLRSASGDIAAQLRFTRVQAIATGERKDFVIDPRAHAWQAPKKHHGTLPKQLGIEFYGAREVQPSPGQGAIAFFPDGASTGGRIRLRAKKAVRDIDVAWLTGEVRVKRGDADSP
jgi:general secretion pathway protein H